MLIFCPTACTFYNEREFFVSCYLFVTPPHCQCSERPDVFCDHARHPCGLWGVASWHLNACFSHRQRSLPRALCVSVLALYLPLFILLPNPNSSTITHKGPVRLAHSSRAWLINQRASFITQGFCTVAWQSCDWLAAIKDNKTAAVAGWWRKVVLMEQVVRIMSIWLAQCHSLLLGFCKD